MPLAAVGAEARGRAPRATWRGTDWASSAAPVILEFVYGACDALDDYSSYLTPDKLDDLFAMIDGNFVGLGVELKQDDQGLRLVGVIPRRPGGRGRAEAGRPDHPGRRQADRRARARRGRRPAPGARGHAPSRSPCSARRLDPPYRLVRRHVEVDSVAQAKMVDPAAGIGYVQLTGFQKTSTDELDRAIAGLRRQGMRSLVLDLRGNPGGLLNVAVEIADRFIDEA